MPLWQQIGWACSGVAMSEVRFTSLSGLMQFRIGDLVAASLPLVAQQQGQQWSGVEFVVDVVTLGMPGSEVTASQGAAVTRGQRDKVRGHAARSC